MNSEEFFRRHRERILAAVTAAVAVLLLVLVLPPPPGIGDLPAFDQQDVEARKQAFFDYLRPIAQYHNERIAEDRAELDELTARDSLGWFGKRKVRALARKYRVELAEDIDYGEVLATLKRRVDVIPESLVLVQAAKESAWGRSRFAREGNALFGEWCFTDGCGMVPDARAADAGHEVRSFDSVRAAMGSYMRNLNTHRSYIDMRIARQLERQNGERPTGIELAGYLGRYSERRDAYVSEVRSMIRQNGLENPGSDAENDVEAE